MDIAGSNLYQLFNALSGEELKDLEKAVHSPFFNYRQPEIKLFDYLLKARKKNLQTLPGAEASKYVLGQSKPDLPKLRHVMTYLTRIINRYLAIREMELSGQEHLLLARTMRKRGLSKLFLSQYQTARHYFDEEAPVKPDTYYNQLQLHTEFYSYSITNRRAQDNQLQQLTDSLDLFYVVQQLKQACNILSYKNIFKYEYLPELAQTIQLIEKKNLLKNQLVKLLYFNYKCLAEPGNEQHFAQLKPALLQAPARIDIRELKDIFTLAINYCIKRLNTGGQEYYQHVFDIYQAGLQRKVFEENGVLSPFTYKNISAIALGLMEYRWAEKFIEDYRAKLDSEVRDGFYAYCKARYYFGVGKYPEVAGLLREVEIKEQFTDLDARVLLIKTYYELDQDSLLDYSIGNLKQQLKRKQLQTYHHEVYKNFVRMISRVAHLRTYDKAARLLLAKKITDTKAIAEKEWLLGKLKRER